ncbi:unnamed protein product, partial [Discosporangium mesarthrocarpum]
SRTNLRAVVRSNQGFYTESCGNTETSSLRAMENSQETRTFSPANPYEVESTSGAIQSVELSQQYLVGAKRRRTSLEGTELWDEGRTIDDPSSGHASESCEDTIVAVKQGIVVGRAKEEPPLSVTQRPSGGGAPRRTFEEGPTTTAASEGLTTTTAATTVTTATTTTTTAPGANSGTLPLVAGVGVTPHPGIPGRREMEVRQDDNV